MKHWKEKVTNWQTTVSIMRNQVWISFSNRSLLFLSRISYFSFSQFLHPSTSSNAKHMAEFFPLYNRTRFVNFFWKPQSLSLFPFPLVSNSPTNNYTSFNLSTFLYLKESIKELNGISKFSRQFSCSNLLFVSAPPLSFGNSRKKKHQISLLYQVSLFFHTKDKCISKRNTQRTFYTLFSTFSWRCRIKKIPQPSAIVTNSSIKA